ncbi:MAG: hypothetical protein RIT45_3455 [Pseudomonadota bacterium]|jgi:RNA polymerase sigma-70 factor (ECF subfamily)
MQAITVSPEMTDAELHAALAAQVPAALQVFHDRYRALMYSTARKIVRDEWDTEEVVQDVVWTVFRKAHAFRGDSGLSTWVYRITQNCARMLLRKRRRVPLPMESEAMDFVVAASREGECWHLPEAQLAGRDAALRFQTAYAALPDDNRALFHAMDFEGEDKEVVAEQLGLSVSALKARLHRVRKHLRDATLGEAVVAA